MPTTSRTFKNDVTLKPGFVLFVGRKKIVINKPARFEMKREHAVEMPFEWSEELIASIPFAQIFSLFIDGKLFATARPSDSRRGSVFIRKPRSKRGKLQIHFVKKYTTLAPA